MLSKISRLFQLNFVITFHYSILLACNKMKKANKIADYYNECYLIMANFKAFIFIGTQVVQPFIHVKLSKSSVKIFAMIKCQDDFN